MTAEWRNDGSYVDSLGAIANSLTGLGTSRDKTQWSRPNLHPYILQKAELEGLYRSSKFCEKAVRLLPMDAARHWCQWQSEDDELDLGAIAAYERRLKLKNTFGRAGMLGRLYGDGYVVLGIDDGLPFDEPVDRDNIRSIRWAKALSRWRLTPDITTDAEDPERFTIVMGVRTKLPEDPMIDSSPRRFIHKSRVLRFPGKRLFEDGLQANGGHNDSVLQSMFSDFNAYLSAVNAASAMVQDFSVFTYKLKGLATLVNQGETEKLMKRFTAIQMGMSVLKGLMMDADTEEATYIQRNFAGLQPLIRELQDVAVAAADMPRTKLLGGANVGAFSEAGQSDRYEWADCVSQYQTDFFQEPLEQVAELMFLAQDSPTNGEVPEDWSIKWCDSMRMTAEETANLRKLNAESDKLYIEMNVVNPEEIRRSRFGNSDYQQEITLMDPEELEELEREAIAETEADAS